MKRVDIPGGWYGEALPSGEFAVLVTGSHIATHLGNIPLPQGENVLFIRITTVGGFKFAGQGHTSPNTWEWQNGTWTAKPTACGVSPVIYDKAGVLHISDCSIGSQGWRYVAPDGSLITGDATYADIPRQLFEYTVLGPLTIGQGNADCHVLVNGKRLLLESGECRFIRSNLDATGMVAVTIAKFAERKTVMFWGTVDEFAALPPVVAPTPEPPPVTQPPPPPMPEVLQAPNELARIKKIFAAHPDINTKDEVARGKILDYCCAELGSPPWGRKARNKDGTNKNTDALVYKRTDGRIEIYDVIGGGSGSAQWGKPTKSLAPGENGYWAPPDPIQVTPPPPPIPPVVTPPPAPPLDLSPILDLLKEIQREVVDLAAAVARVEARKFPSYRGRLGVNLNLDPDEK